MSEIRIPDHFKPPQQPVAAASAAVGAGSARFTVLTDRLIRLEYHPEQRFEDRASQAFWFREQPVPEFSVRSSDDLLEIETSSLLLRYLPRVGAGFGPANLTVTLKASGQHWHPGAKAAGNLLGTTRTLDAINGYAPLELGLLSRDGWAVLDDSATLVFTPDYWIEPRTPGGTDWYFFGYGHDYKACLRDYCRVSGQMPLIPRWILGNWWSRYWAYTQDELQGLMNDFQAHEIPLSVCIVDMDWHLTKTGNLSSGWTGYTWNRELIPDPEGLIRFFHDKGLRTALNLHPAEGVHDHEAQYPEMARRMGIDPATRQPVRFNITNPEFAKAYFEVLHHPQEAMGIDFWWVDWQQGQASDLPGLDPLWLINHLHYHDLGRNGTRRPFIFSRWGREGHQRYPIGFSGDTYRSWESLAFQAYMTPTASNIGYGWWSHDIGGHASGWHDAELFTRWVQFGVFSPIMRMHVTKGRHFDVRPWEFEDIEVTRVLRHALQLRHALIPYLYTMAWRAYKESLPLAQPMYYDYPEHDDAYHCPQQYQFGTELVVAPYVAPANAEIGLSRQVVWLPPGDWYHFFTGEHYAGGGWHALYGKLSDVPVFAKAGAIVPMGSLQGWGGINNPSELHVHVFAGADNTFTLYEDDSDGMAYTRDVHALTRFEQRWSPNRLEFTISTPPANDLIPERRTFHLKIRGVMNPARLSATLDGAAVTVSAAYDEATETLQLSGIEIGSSATLRLMAEGNIAGLLSHRSRKHEKILHMLKWFRTQAGIRDQLAARLDTIYDDPAQLAPYLIAMTEAQGRALFEVICEAGLNVVRDTQWPAMVVVWNNRASDRITYRYADANFYFGFLNDPHHSNGIVPRFAAFTPPDRVWRHGSNEAHVHETQWRAQIDYLNLLTVVESHQEVTP